METMEIYLTDLKPEMQDYFMKAKNWGDSAVAYDMQYGPILIIATEGGK